jgi:hypothetical protein
MTMVRKSIISAGAWHYYYTLSLLTNYIVGPIAGWFNPASKSAQHNNTLHCTVPDYTTLHYSTLHSPVSRNVVLCSYVLFIKLRCLSHHSISQEIRASSSNTVPSFLSFSLLIGIAATPGGLFAPCAILVCAVRFNVRGVNKYALWGAVVVSQALAMYYLNRYTSVVF